MTCLEFLQVSRGVHLNGRDEAQSSDFGRLGPGRACLRLVRAVERAHGSVTARRCQKPVDWILGSAGSLSLPSAEPSDGVLDTEAEEQSSESLAVDARRFCSSFSWACSTSRRCRSLLINPSIVWKISSTFLIT